MIGDVSNFSIFIHYISDGLTLNVLNRLKS